MVNNLYTIFKNLSKFIREVFCFTLILISVSLTAQPNLQFKTAKQKFGFVNKGEVVTLEYQFTNTGNQPLLISDAKAECSCTTVKFPQQPILPNQSDKIIVVFDTKSTYDRQDRLVEIVSNSKKAHQLIRFKGVVVTK